MQGFGIRAARAINGTFGRRGTVWAERYAVTRVMTATQMRNTLCYVLHNARRHGARVRGVDELSSARYFDGWAKATGLPPPDESEAPPVAPPSTELLRKRWRYIGLIDPDETPRTKRQSH